MELSDLGEFSLIDRISVGCLIRPSDVTAGIGDDCAVVPIDKGRSLLLTTDMLIEDIHFWKQDIIPELLGRKSLAVNISDIAAMGGIPKDAVLSLGLPVRTDLVYIDRFYDGIKSIAGEFSINILGGDTVKSPDRLVINIALTGEAPSDEILYRSGAKEGDIIFITGFPGNSSAGLNLLDSGRDFEAKDELFEFHLNPRPQYRQGRIIAESKLASSLIDISDGLLADLGHICRASSVGAIVRRADVPIGSLLQAYCEKYNLDPLDFALGGGEDYILLGTVPEKSSDILKGLLEKDGFAYFPIGTITCDLGTKLGNPDGSRSAIDPSGYDHFK